MNGAKSILLSTGMKSLLAAAFVCSALFAAGQEKASSLPASAAESAVQTCPDPLIGSDGKEVSSPERWEKVRRGEILELFRANVYGRNPVERPDSLRIEAVGEADDAMEGMAVRRQFDISYKGPGGEGKFRLLLFVPKAARKPVPAFLFICNRGKKNIDPDREEKSPFWPAEEIVSRGYAAAAFFNGDVAPDRPDAFLKEGAAAIFDSQEGRKPDSWGAIGVWAWGASRAMDCLEAVPEIDKGKVAVVGHSRGGKTALWCGAQDIRFAMAVSNGSGCSGAAMARGKKGEHVADINKTFPHWFCGNYKKFDNAEASLPVDQHMLIALMAPRLVYVASAQDDAWADPASEFRSCILASPVYALFGLKGPGQGSMPAIEKPLHSGVIAYHIRPGVHDLTLYDWNRFMDFADLKWKGSAP